MSTPDISVAQDVEMNVLENLGTTSPTGVLHDVVAVGTDVQISQGTAPGSGDNKK
ncbi:MAG TPA: hypothetical protein VMI73_08970 [Trebonia sp.]|nr:hypothetical protein [Trebonia sp.]